MALHFSDWLQQELDKREWNQSDLARSAKQRGYTLGTAQVSRILNQDQEAGIGSVIAIAHGLGISREVTFQARGWLPTTIFHASKIDPTTITLIQDLDALPPKLKAVAQRATRVLVDSLTVIALEEEQEM